MLKLEILNHWIFPQQGKNHSEIDEEPLIYSTTPVGVTSTSPASVQQRRSAPKDKRPTACN